MSLAQVLPEVGGWYFICWHELSAVLPITSSDMLDPGTPGHDIYSGTWQRLFPNELPFRVEVAEDGTVCCSCRAALQPNSPAP